MPTTIDAKEVLLRTSKARIDPADTVVITSGGLDSTVLLHYAIAQKKEHRIWPISFSYGQRHLRELTYARSNCDKLGLKLELVNIPWMWKLNTSAITNPDLKVPTIKEVLGHPQPVTYVPFRNLLFLTIALQFAEDRGASYVWYGAQVHDLYGYWDATEEFVLRLNAITELNRQHRIGVRAPLARNSKADNIALGVDLGVDFQDTYSCYRGEEFHCGNCPTCSERMKGFQDAGVPDPTVYNTAPY